MDGILTWREHQVCSSTHVTSKSYAPRTGDHDLILNGTQVFRGRVKVREISGNLSSLHLGATKGPNDRKLKRLHAHGKVRVGKVFWNGNCIGSRLEWIIKLLASRIWSIIQPSMCLWEVTRTYYKVKPSKHSPRSRIMLRVKSWFPVLGISGSQNPFLYPILATWTYYLVCTKCSNYWDTFSTAYPSRSERLSRKLELLAL